MYCSHIEISSSISSLLRSFKKSSISAKTSKIYSIKHRIIALIGEYVLRPILSKCSLHQATRAHRCFGIILAFLGSMYETMWCCRRIQLIIEVLIERIILVLAYRAKSVKEFVSSRICSSLMSRVCRIVVLSGCQYPILSPQFHIYRIYESSDV